MAAGFRGPLFLLSLSAAAAVSQGGYQNPLPVPPLSGSSGPGQAGFVSAIPVVNLGGNAVEKAGFIGPVPVVNLGAGEAIEPEPAAGDARGLEYRPVKSQLDLQLQREDEEILAVVAAFMRMIQ